MTLYRPHRRTLHESIVEVTYVEDFADLVQHLQATCPDWYPDDERPTAENIQVINYHSFDDRILWETYLVTVKGNAWGFTNGPLPK